MSWTMPRPSITWKMRRSTMRFGGTRVISSPSTETLPRVMAPSSTASRPEIAFSVVDLPAPLAPSSAVMPPRRASRLSPRSTRMTSLKTTSMFLTSRIASPADVRPSVAVVAASMLVSLRLRAPACRDDLLAEPAIFALEHGVGDLIDLDLAVLEVSAVDRDRHGAAMVGRGPGRRDADAFEAFRHLI